MKVVFLFLIGFITLSCSSDDNGKLIDNPEKITALKYTVKEKNEPNKPVYTQEYTFDGEGKVISENYTNFYNPEYSHFSLFEYNKKGQVTKEIRDGQIHFYIKWTNDFAQVFDDQDQNISLFNFVGDKLTDYKTEYNSNSVRTRILNYDSNQNIVSIENDTEVFVEFIDYSTSKRNPLNLIKSIGILRIDYRPFFKNIFGVEKVYPFEGDDYSFPLTFYDYHYEFDSENRVFRIEDDKSYPPYELHI